MQALGDEREQFLKHKEGNKEKASSLYRREETTEKFMLTQRPQVVN